MIPIFLEEMFVNAQVSDAQLSTLFALIAGLFVVFFIVMIALYIYMSFAYMAIARKTKYPSPGIAWIPLVGPSLIASKAAKMHWWPILLFLSFLILWIPLLGQLIYVLCMVLFAVFFIIWMWKTFEVVKKPGWWAIFMIIPILNIVYLVFLGIAAWGK